MKFQQTLGLCSITTLASSINTDYAVDMLILLIVAYILAVATVYGGLVWALGRRYPMIGYAIKILAGFGLAAIMIGHVFG